jgi:hypothetical protein
MASWGVSSHLMTVRRHAGAAGSQCQSSNAMERKAMTCTNSYKANYHISDQTYLATEHFIGTSNLVG